MVYLLLLRSCPAASGLCARPPRNFRVPSRQVLLPGLNRDFRDTSKVDRNHCRDVRDRELVARDIAPVRKLGVEPREAVLGVVPLHFGVLRALPDTPFEELVPLAEAVGDRLQHRELHPPVPHIDQRAFLRTDAEQWWFGMQFLEVAADRDAL